MKRLVTDSDLDRLLAARVTATSAAFEQRWHVRRRDPSVGPRFSWWRDWRGWLLIAAPASLAAALALWLRVGPPPAPADYELLFGLEESLGPAAVLLDPANRELCLALPPDSPLSP